ncbi:hypothetical protein T492DRAFT_994876 [Pavlovales sp. CCMP2436]|nr:hypothetical protein T492DRAFT_994876 [Pavlovales sp. CCMP2436]|mmetsp:Transcript_11322/g.28674  ORF Transcript_11322/g.28674 Transcript_11322/m.28674 type:complete len:295 (-) Transcript_11322:388-1272(-)
MFNPISNADPRQLYGDENRPRTAAAPPLARNPILDAGIEQHSTRRAFQPVVSKEEAMFDGCHRGKGVLSAENCAGLLSARRGEILFSDVPPRRAPPSSAEGCAGFGSKTFVETHRGKGQRPMTSAGSGNPITQEAMGAVERHHAIPEMATLQLKGQLGRGLQPTGDGDDDAYRPTRRPATARPVDEDVSSDGAAGSTSRQLHRRIDDAHGKAHATPSATAEGINDILHYVYAGRNSTDLSASACVPVQVARSEYELQLAAAHVARQSELGSVLAAYAEQKERNIAHGGGQLSAR